MKELPKNWSKSKLDDLLTFVLGGDWGKSLEYDDPNYTEVRCIRASEMKNWDYEKGSTAAARKIKKTSLESRKLKESDIIVEISGGGPEQPVGRTVIIDKSVLSKTPDLPKVCTNFFRLIRPSSELSSPYLNYFLQYFYRCGEIRNYQAGSNNLRNLKFNNYIEIKIPIAPTNEQKRIVSKIEELFSELDNGIENLKTAREQLKVYRQAILKHAFEGKLTADWRDENKGKLKTAEELLEHIKQEREVHYQQQLDEWKEGKNPVKPKKPDQFSDLIDKETSQFTTLPDRWSYIQLGSLIDKPKYGTSKKCDYEFSGLGVLRIPNVTSGMIDDSDLKYAEFDDDEIETYKLKQGDILTIRSNGSISIVGKCAVISENEEKYLYAGYLIRLRPNKRLVFPKYLLALLSSHMLRHQIEAKAKSTSGVNNINSGEIQSLIVPICSLEEQSIIVEELSAALSSIDKLEYEIEENLLKSEALRQSILKQAFSGKLVAQDPNDEPASVLLERINAEKKENKKSKKGRAA